MPFKTRTFSPVRRGGLRQTISARVGKGSALAVPQFGLLLKEPNQRLPMSTQQIAPISQPHGWRRVGAIILFGALLTSLGFVTMRVVGHDGGIIEGERWLLGKSYLMPVWGAGLWGALLLCGNVNRRAALLLCLSLPGAIALPLLSLTFLLAHDSGLLGVLLIYIMITFYPGACILPLVAVIQGARLRTPQSSGQGQGYIPAAGILALYLWTSYIQNAGSM